MKSSGKECQLSMRDGDPTGRRGSLFIKYTVKLPSVAPSGAFKKQLESIVKPVSAKYDEL